jgi:FkbM family methyltransferase
MRTTLQRRWMHPTPLWRLQSLAERGFVARHIVDVGAYHGEFCDLARQLWPQARLTVLEGAPDALRVLEALLAPWSDVRLLKVLAGATSTEVHFLLEHSNSRVISAELASRSPANHVVRVAQRPLDELLAGQEVDLLKIDVQGHELAVLDGATEVLRRTRAVLVEVSILQIGHAPAWRTVLDRLEAAGFVLVDLIEPKYRPRGWALWQIDLLMLRADEAVVADRSW